MKTATFLKTALALGAAAVLMTSCNKEENNDIVADGGKSSIVLKINLGQASTKAMAPDNEWNTEAPVISQLDIYFTDRSGAIKYAYRAKEGASEDAATIWNNYQTGVRFIGMENVSQVYVVANGPEIVPSSFDEKGTFTGTGNVNQLNIDIEDYTALNDQNTMPYIGADRTPTTLTTAVDNNDNDKVIIDEAGEGGPYVSYEISIRPAVSRIEITQVSILTEGDLYFKEVEDEDGNKTIERCDESDGNVLYKIHYNNFDGTLTGVYMSDFYRDSKLFENPVNLGENGVNWNLFATPTFNEGVAPIADGDWVSIDGAYDNASRYSNWTGTGYASLIDFDTYGTDGTLKYLFDGPNHDNVVIPFNILLPYDVTSQNGQDEGAAPQVDITTPRLHFQFLPVGTIQTSGHQKYNGSNWEPLVAGTDDVEIAMLDGLVQWPYTIESDGIAYANVKSFSKNNAGTEEVEFMTGKIYKLQNVLITPDVLTTDTKSTTSSNVIVTVKVVNFAKENIYPVFD